MKKYLLGTTAFAAASLVTSASMAQSLEDRIRTLEESMLMGSPGSGFDVTVSGFIHGGFVVQDIDALPNAVHCEDPIPSGLADADNPTEGELTDPNNYNHYNPQLGNTCDGSSSTRDSQIGWVNPGGGPDNVWGLKADNPENYASNDVRMGSSEVHFTATTILDNGIEVGGRVELEGFTDSDDQIDETYIWMEGGFGRLQAGAENGASYLMHYSPPWIAGVNGVDSPNYRYAVVTAARTNTQTLISGDANKITYFTPRFSGFQFGISYAPHNENRDGEQNGFGAQASDESVEQIVSAGLNFTRNFGEVSLGASAGWESGTATEKFTNTSDSGPGLITVTKDPVNWHIGGQVSMYGFTFGGSYYRAEGFYGTSGDNSVFVDPRGPEEEDITLDISDDLEQTAWAVGGHYAIGPWGGGIAYFRASAEGLPPIISQDNFHRFLPRGAGLPQRGELETEVIGAALTYEAGPGVTFTGDVNFYEDKDGFGNAVEAVGGGVLMGVSF